MATWKSKARLTSRFSTKVHPGDATKQAGSPSADGGIPSGRQNERNDQLGKLGCVIALTVVVGFICGVIAPIAALKTWFFIESAHSVEGAVVALVRRERDGKSKYAPRVQFTVPSSGRTYEFVSSMASRPPAYRPGEAVTVLYDPGDPGDARIGDIFSLWGPSVLFGFLGILFLSVGAAARVKQKQIEAGKVEPSREG